MATPGMDPQHRVREDVRLHPIRLLHLPLVCRLAPAGIPDPARHLSSRYIEMMYLEDIWNSPTPPI